MCVYVYLHETPSVYAYYKKKKVTFGFKVRAAEAQTCLSVFQHKE